MLIRCSKGNTWCLCKTVHANFYKLCVISAQKASVRSFGDKHELLVFFLLLVWFWKSWAHKSVISGHIPLLKYAAPIACLFSKSCTRSSDSYVTFDSISCFNRVSLVYHLSSTVLVTLTHLFCHQHKLVLRFAVNSWQDMELFFCEMAAAMNTVHMKPHQLFTSKPTYMASLSCWSTHMSSVFMS